MNITVKIDPSQIQEMSLYAEKLSSEYTYYPEKTYKFLFWKHTIKEYIRNNVFNCEADLEEKYYIKDNKVWLKPYIYILFKNGGCVRYYFDNIDQASKAYDHINEPFYPIYID